jgi:methionine-rich copper-binding protein CopC
MQMKKTHLSLIVGALLVLPIDHSWAHSFLTSSNPKAGSVLMSFPKKVTLTFNEDLLVVNNQNPNTLSISRSDGATLKTSPAAVIKNTLAVSLQPSKLNFGRFRVTYRAVSADGHPITGSFFFTVKK